MRQEIRKLRMRALLAMFILFLSLMFVTTPVVAQPYIAPEAFFTYEPTNPVAYQMITFDGSSSTADPSLFIDNYTWDFGDGSRELYSEIARHPYLSAGTYIVTLTVRDNIGGLSSTSKTIIVGEAWYPWPMFHHDQQRTGVSGGGINTTAANLRWTFTVESPATYGVSSSPVIGNDGTIYIGSMGPVGVCPTCPKLYAIYPWGTQKWECETTNDGRICSAPAISPATSNYPNRIYLCTDESSGRYPNIFAIDTATGAKLWTSLSGNGLTLPNNDWVGASNPVVVKDPTSGNPVIYVCGNKEFTGKYRLYRIEDHGTHASIAPLPWPLEFPLYIHPLWGAAPPSPAVAEDGTIYVGTKEDSSVPIGGALYAINPDGTEKWHCEVATTPAEAAGCPAIREAGGQEVIYIGTTDYRMCKVKENPAQNGGTVVWVFRNPYGEPSGTCPAIADLDADGYVDIVFTSSAVNLAHVYAITDMGNDWGDGTTFRTPFWGTAAAPGTTIPTATVSTPVLGTTAVPPPHQYKVFLGACDSKIYTLAGWNGRILAEYRTGITLFGVISSPAVAWKLGWCGGPGWVFVGSNDGNLYAFGPRSRYRITETEYQNSITQPIGVSRIRFVQNAVNEKWVKGTKWPISMELMYWQKSTKYLIEIDIEGNGNVTRVGFRRWGNPTTEIPYDLAEQSLASLPPGFAIGP